MVVAVSMAMAAGHLLLQRLERLLRTCDIAARQRRAERLERVLKARRTALARRVLRARCALRLPRRAHLLHGVEILLVGRERALRPRDVTGVQGGAERGEVLPHLTKGTAGGLGCGERRVACTIHGIDRHLLSPGG